MLGAAPLGQNSSESDRDSGRKGTAKRRKSITQQKIWVCWHEPVPFSLARPLASPSGRIDSHQCHCMSSDLWHSEGIYSETNYKVTVIVSKNALHLHWGWARKLKEIYIINNSQHLDISLLKKHLKGQFTQKYKLCHDLFAIMSFKTCLRLF